MFRVGDIRFGVKIAKKYALDGENEGEMLKILRFNAEMFVVMKKWLIFVDTFIEVVIYAISKRGKIQ